MTDPLFWLHAGLRLSAWSCLLWIGGSAVWRLAVVDHRSEHAPGARGALMAALLLLATRAGQLYVQTRTFFGAEGVDFEALATVAGGTAWGHGWLLQSVAAILLLASSAAAGRTSRAWPAVVVSGGAAVAAEPLTGHAVEGGAWSWPWFLQALHMGGAVVWIGGLAVLVASLVAARMEPEAVRRAVHRFSPLALGGAAIVAISGVLTGLEYLTSVGDLWRTEWGRALCLKLLLVTVVSALGWVNWRRVRPRLGSPESSDLLRLSAGVELVVALAVLIVTALLVGLQMPAA